MMCIGAGQHLTAGLCEDGNECSVSTKGEDFLNRQSKCRNHTFKKNFFISLQLEVKFHTHTKPHVNTGDNSASSEKGA